MILVRDLVSAINIQQSDIPRMLCFKDEMTFGQFNCLKNMDVS